MQQHRELLQYKKLQGRDEADILQARDGGEILQGKRHYTGRVCDTCGVIAENLKNFHSGLVKFYLLFL